MPKSHYGEIELTISLPEELLEQVDRECEAIVIPTSRSQVIAMALRKHLNCCCFVCGTPWANTWMTSDKIWDHYISPPNRGKILCRPCWNKIVDARDHGKFEAEHHRDCAYGKTQPI
jgi:hypothetical protein